MYFRMLHDEFSGELTYLLADVHAKEAVLIDPHSRDLDVLSALLAEHDLQLRWVLRTHHHDHLHSEEFQNLAQLGAPLIQGDAPVRAFRPDDGASLAFGNEALGVWSTPGHTATCLSFAWRDRLFCGGLLNTMECPDQPFAAAPAQLWESITQRLFKFPNETLLFSGHAQHLRTVSTIMDQRRWNPSFTGCSRDEFLASMASLPDQPIWNAHNKKVKQ
jgi:glyoxylase-like metal-dependent hydrolase (beta-lactamase superfamily II)